MNDKTETADTAKVKLRVYVPGTHAGKRYTPGPDGIELEVSESQANALKKRGADKPPSNPEQRVPSPPAGPAAERISSPGASVAEVPAARGTVTTRPQG